MINDINSTQETSERNRGINSAQKIEDTNMYQEIERQNEKERITTNLSSLIEKLSTTNEFTKKSETYASSDDEVEKKVYQIENINVNVENISEIEEIEQFLDSLKSYIGD